MDTYMLIMYVTHEQESAIQSLFTDKDWIFCKSDPDKLMPSRKIICRFDSLDNVVPTIYTESNLGQKHTTLYGDLYSDIPKLIDNRNVVADTNVQKIQLNFESSCPDVEIALKVPDIKLKECFVSLKRIYNADTQYKRPGISQLVEKKRKRTKETTESNATKLSTVKKSRDQATPVVNIPVEKRENKDAAASKIEGAIKKEQDVADLVPEDKKSVTVKEKTDDIPTNKIINRSRKTDSQNETSASKEANDAESSHKSVNDDDESDHGDLDYADSDNQVDQIGTESDDEIYETKEINEFESDHSDYRDPDDGNDAAKDPDYGTKLKVKKKIKKEVYKCETCYKTYKFEISYRKHKEKNCGVAKIKIAKVDKRSRHGEYRCTTCNKLYTYKKNYHAHFLDGVCMCKCKYCGKIVRNDLKKHIFYMHETKEEKIRCEVCKKRLYDKIDLRDHMLVHSDVKNFVCDQCGKAFVKPLALYAHKKSHEKVSNKPRCDICQKRFNTSSNLDYHRKVTHSDVRNSVCEVCGKRFKTNRCLKSHMRAHSTIRPYQCDICNKYYKYIHQVYAHKRIYHTKIRRFFCSVCNKGFYFQHKLTDHMNIHSGTKVHSCEHCSYMSYTGMQMTQHKRKHRKPKAIVTETVPKADSTLLNSSLQQECLN